MELEPDRSALKEGLSRVFPELRAQRFPGEEESALDELVAAARWSSVLGCWLVGHLGMTVGIERDGSVHT